ncbi:MAG: hypothetical protein BGO29_05740 [Bacteroidales bacterium 36-12]|nr:MAG: hypothetical protein BGO29_05740 [Bacteroidales bacterium 36-12]
MKKNYYLMLFILINLSIYSQKTIENPKFTAATSSFIKITQIELQDSVTKISLEVKLFPQWWIGVSTDKTFIQYSSGGEKIYVKRAEGLILNEKNWLYENGMISYSLYFPPINKDIKKIDFIQSDWQIYELNLSGDKDYSLVPEQIIGNWLKTDGSNEWVYGFFKDKIIYKSKVWTNVSINNKGKNYVIILTDGLHKETIFLKLRKKDLLIGSESNNLELYSRSRTNKDDFIIKNDQEYSMPIFKPDTAILKGVLSEYHPKMGTTGMIYVKDVFTQEQHSHLVEINKDGSFELKVYLIHPQMVYMSIFNIKDFVLLEPGETTFQYINMQEFSSVYEDTDSFINREKKSLFMGNLAQVHSDLLILDTINYFSYDKAEKEMAKMDGEQYKAYCLSIMNKEQAALSHVAEKNTISKKALQLKQMQIKFKTQYNILDFNRIKEYTNKDVNNSLGTLNKNKLEYVEFGPEYYDFLDIDEINNPLSVVSPEYSRLINKMKFSERVRPNLNIVSYRLQMKEFNPITQKDTTYVIDSTYFVHPKTKEKILVDESFDIEKYSQDNMRTYFGLDKGFATDIMYSQSVFEKMIEANKPLTKDEKDNLRNLLSDSLVVDYLIQQSDILERKITEISEANKHKTGYVVNDTPETSGDKLFDAIIGRYKGKLIFVDFWATWCGPCRHGIEAIKPLKEELKNANIEFVYITNTSSPEDTWNLMIPTIKGQHYRLKSDEWNYLAAKFNIIGIPHYVLVDENGVVVNDNVRVASSNDMLRNLFQQYLNK